MAGEPPVTSVRNPRVQRLRALREPRARVETGFFLVEGVKLASEALAPPAEPVEAVVSPRLAGSAAGRRLEAALSARPLPLLRVSDRVLEAVADSSTHQGVVVVARRRETALDELARPGRRPLLLVAVGVQEPGNLGALVRVAEALGAHGLLALGEAADPWGPRAARAAAGSLFRLAVARERDPGAGLALLAGRGYRLCAAVARGGEPPGPALGERPLALVVGSEGTGLDEESLAHASRRVTLPLEPPVESLNVAAAAAVLLHLARGG